VLVGITGGIAAYKACELVRLLVRAGHEVRVVATRSALEFVSPLTLQTLSGHAVRSELFSLTDESEISHIDLADWAEVFAIAPATANVIGELAHGLAPDLLTTVALATHAELLLAPAMNVNMYGHPATQENLATLAKRGASIVGPDRGELACGWEGEGRLVEPERIAAAVDTLLHSGELGGEVVTVTAGPTEEPLDPVRVITNRSSGRMGFALAEEAARRGAEVLLIAGPVSLVTPYGVERIDVRTTEEMRRAVHESFERSTIVIKAAAVSDYRAAHAPEQKIKREKQDALSIDLVRNPDIAAEVGAKKGSRTVVVFAAETERVLEHARDKLERKQASLVVANDVSRDDIGFEVDRNEVDLIGPGRDDHVHVPAGTKREIARSILDRIRELRST
jgi:phosphopantothenoylcysteine decarboxylase/phosphopantothenate--cysteine ligase